MDNHDLDECEPTQAVCVCVLAESLWGPIPLTDGRCIAWADGLAVAKNCSNFFLCVCLCMAGVCGHICMSVLRMGVCVPGGVRSRGPFLVLWSLSPRYAGAYGC